MRALRGQRADGRRQPVSSPRPSDRIPPAAGPRRPRSLRSPVAPEGRRDRGWIQPALEPRSLLSPVALAGGRHRGWISPVLGPLGAWAVALAFAGQPAEVALAVAVGLLAVAVAGHLAGALRAAPQRPVGWAAAPVRARAAVPRYLDPDAAGRPRPRAPSRNPSAA